MRSDGTDVVQTMSLILNRSKLTEYDSYSCDYLHIDVYEKYLSEESSKALYDYVLNKGPFHNSYLTKAGVPSKKRNKLIYGDPALDGYTITYLGKTIKTQVRPWSEMPILKELAEMLEETTGQKYHVCTIQLYNNGEVGIKPHRDKEMTAGTIITSISLGETRAMKFERRGCEALSIPLSSGTLCLIRPPTNDYWLHSIPLDNTKGFRMSLIFRNCESMLKLSSSSSCSKI